MSESEPYRKSSWWIRSKEQPDLSHLKEWQNRLRAGEEAIFYNLRVVQQNPRNVRYLAYEQQNGRGVISEFEGPNIDSLGRRHLDQLHDYYLANINSPRVEPIRVNFEHLRIQIDSNQFAQRRSSYQFGEEFPGGEEILLLPTTAELIAAGSEEIEKWMERSAYRQDIYSKLRARIKESKDQLVSEITEFLTKVKSNN